VYLGMLWLHDKRVGPRAINWLCAAHFAGSKWFGWIRPAYVFPAALVGLACFYRWALIGVFVALGLVVFATAGILLTWQADLRQQRLRERREVAIRQANEARLDRFLRIKFALLHPRKAQDVARSEQHYQAWLQRYRSYMEAKYGVKAFEQDLYIHHYYIDEPYARYMERQAKLAASSQPSRFDHIVEVALDGLSRALNVVCEFLALVWMVLVTKKWRVCPLVELPTRQEG